MTSARRRTSGRVRRREEGGGRRATRRVGEARRGETCPAAVDASARRGKSGRAASCEAERRVRRHDRALAHDVPCPLVARAYLRSSVRRQPGACGGVARSIRSRADRRRRVDRDRRRPRRGAEHQAADDDTNDFDEHHRWYPTTSRRCRDLMLACCSFDFKSHLCAPSSRSRRAAAPVPAANASTNSPDAPCDGTAREPRSPAVRRHARHERRPEAVDSTVS